MVVQGDVYFISAERIPHHAAAKKKDHRGFVIAEGEATGHAHVIDDDIELFEADGTLYVRTVKEVRVTHEEHRPLTLRAGLWRVGRIREYDPFLEEVRLVRD